MEAIDPQPVEGIRATGANALEEILYGVIPQVLPLWISYSLYRFESNVRSASVVGMVGAGGIGVVLWEIIRGFQYAQTCAVMLIIVVDRRPDRPGLGAHPQGPHLRTQAMALDIEQIVQLYRTEGVARYGTEAINQEQHALQCGLLAQEAGADAPLVAAALLHDLGHLLTRALPETASDKDDLHEYRCIPFLRGAFGDAVIEPMRLHVPAKRYLCWSEPAYLDSLSPASRRSLELQGGVLSAEQAAAFIAQPHAQAAVALRRWDDLAKSPSCITPGWDHFLGVLDEARRA